MHKYLFIASEFGSHNAVFPVLEELAGREQVGYIGVKDIENLPLVLQKKNTSVHEAARIYHDFDVFLTGTSGYSMIEYNAWKYAQEAGKKSFCILDQWKNYKERFCRNGGILFPDSILVIDDISRQNILHLGARDDQVIVTGSPHLDRLIEMGNSSSGNSALKKKFRVGDRRVVTFCTESIVKLREKRKYGYDEYTVIEDILEYLKDRIDTLLIIKPHPDDDIDIYQKYSGSSQIRIAGDVNTIDLFKVSDAVVGMNSMALLEAYLMKVPIISYQPVDKLNIRDDVRLILDVVGAEKTIFTRVDFENKLDDILDNRFEFHEFYTHSRSTDRIVNLLLN